MSYYCEDSKRYWLDSKKIWLDLEDLKGILQAFGFDRTPMARDLLAPAQPPTRVQGATTVEHIEHIESSRQRMTDWGEWMLQKMVSQTTLSYYFLGLRQLRYPFDEGNRSSTTRPWPRPTSNQWAGSCPYTVSLCTHY